MAENNLSICYLLDPFEQYMNLNGKPLVGGWIEIFEAGTDTKVISYQNFDGTQNPFKVPIGTDGRVVILVQDNQAYDVYVYSSNGNLVCSRLNVAPTRGSGGTLMKVTHDETLTGAGTQLSPLGVSPLTNLAVDDTLTAYEATVEGKESLVLGVNGDWFSAAFSGLSDEFVSKDEFSACCSAVKGGLDNKVDLSALNNYYNKQETWNTFMPRSGIDLSDYYTTAQVYNKSEIDTQLIYKQDRLTFEYDENSAISSINSSALAGGNGDATPWISGAKIIADTQTMDDNMLIQVLSSFTLSGNKNHCIAVKGGMYRFPNAYELGDRIATTNYFMANSAMSSYLPASSFSSYTTYAEGRMDSIFQLANSAYTTAVNNYHNKLDISAFSAWSADLVLSGDYYPMTGNPSGFLTAHQDLTYISAQVDNKLDKSESGNYYPMEGNPSGFLTEHQDLSYISGKIDDKLDTTALENLSGEFYPMTGNPSGFLTQHQDISDLATKEEVSEVSSLLSSTIIDVSAAAGDVTPWISGAKILDETKYLMPGDFFQALSSFTLSGNKNHCIAVKGGGFYMPNNYMLASCINETQYFVTNSAYSADLANYLPTASFTGYTATVNPYFNQLFSSAAWLVTNKLDISSFSSYSANLSGEYYPLTGNPSGFLTEHQDLSYISGKVDDKLDTTAYEQTTGNYYPMTGNPSGFLTAHQSLDDYATTAQVNTVSSVLSGAIDYVSANVGGSAQVNLLYVYSHDNNGEMTYTVPTYTDVEDYVKNKAPVMVVVSGQKETEYGPVAVNCSLNYVGEIGYDEETTGYRFFGIDYVGFNDQNENNLTREIQGTQIDFYTDGETTGYGISSNVYVNDKLTTATHYINPAATPPTYFPVVSQIFDTDISARVAGSASVAGYASNVASASLWNAAYNIIKTYSGQWLLANP